MPKKRDKQELDDDSSSDEYESEIYKKSRYNFRSTKQKTSHNFDFRTSLTNINYVSSTVIPTLNPSPDIETDIEGQSVRNEF